MKKKKLKLSYKFVIGFVLLGILISVAGVVISYGKYKTAVEKEYNDTAYRIAAVAMSYVNGDDIERYLLTGRTDDAYETMGVYLSDLRANMDVNHIFIAQLEGQRLLYIYDVDNPDDDFDQFQLGDIGGINPLFEDDLRNVLVTGSRSSNYFYSHSEFGYNTSAVVPIFNSRDEIIAILVVEIAMEMLQSILYEYVLFVSIASVGLIALFITAYLIYLQRKVVRPIQIMTHEADSFIRNDAEVSKLLKSINTGDEIEQLAGAIHKMEIDIKSYIENLTAVTAERERISAELGIAAQIQLSMLPCEFPAFPDLKALDIHASMVAAKEVGGDFYDFFLIDDKTLVLVIADVSDKGIPAALFMMITKILLKNQALSGYSAADVFTTVNDQLCEHNDANMFVTAWMGMYDLQSGKLTCVNAGHNPPLLRRANGQYEYLKIHVNFVLGGMEGIRYRAQELYLHEGDQLFLYTDGVTEAADLKYRLYGEDRLRDRLNSMADCAPRDVLNWVAEDVRLFVGDAPQVDDITMLAFHVFDSGNSSLTVDTSPDNYERIRDFIDRTLEDNGGTTDIRTQFKIVSDEILSNIFKYSQSRSVTTTVWAHARGALVSFTDDGLSYNPLRAEEPDVTLPAERREIGGLGIFITKKLMDEVTYDFVDQKNVLTVYKRFGDD